MTYRITIDDKKCLHIDDVLVCDEELLSDYQEKIGSVHHEVVEMADFFNLLSSGICGAKTIARFESEEGKYSIDWLEVLPSGSVMHRDVIEVCGERDAFDNEMSRCLTAYNSFFRHFTQKKVYSAYAKSANEDEIFKKIWDILVEHGYEYVESDAKTAVEMYEYLQSHKEEFMACPIKKDSYTTYKVGVARFLLVLMAIVATISVVVTIPAGSLLFIIQFVWSCLLVGLTFSRQIRLEAFIKTGSLSVLSTSLAKTMDRSLLKTCEDFTNNKVNVVSLAKEAIKICKNNSGLNYDADEFYRLMEAYSKEYSEKFDGYSSSIDKYEYVRRLLAKEKKMFATNKNYLMLTSTPIIGFGHFYEILECLGWSKEIVKGDAFLYEIRSTITTIMENAYAGCECELIDLIEIAVDYARQVGIGKESLSEEETIRVRDLTARANDVFDTICKRIAYAQALEETIAAHIKTDTIGVEQTLQTSQEKRIAFTPNKKKTLGN